MNNINVHFFPHFLSFLQNLFNKYLFSYCLIDSFICRFLSSIFYSSWSFIFINLSKGVALNSRILYNLNKFCFFFGLFLSCNLFYVANSFTINFWLTISSIFAYFPFASYTDIVFLKNDFPILGDFNFYNNLLGLSIGASDGLRLGKFYESLLFWCLMINSMRSLSL